MRGKAVQLATALAGTLIVASLASGLLGGTVLPGPDAPADPEPASVEAPDGEHGHTEDEATTHARPDAELQAVQPRHQHPLAPGEGEIPTRAEASELPHQFERFLVEGDEGLAQMDERGYLEGSGTLDDPYVIRGFRVHEDLTIEDTDKALVIKDSYIEGQLTLNFVGDDVYVHADGIVWNFDGYHLGHVHNNSVEGRVDVKLHGHFHASCQLCAPHDHAEPAAFPPGNDRPEAGDPVSRHSYRFHTLDLENNTIRAPDQAIALRVYDEAHAGDDQTANSEPNAHLEDRHEHHQYVRVAHNSVHGGSVIFDIVNAEDADHHRGLVQEARIDLVGNEVTLEQPTGQGVHRAAYAVHAVDTLRLAAQDNRFAFERGDDGSAMPAGYRWMVEDEPGRSSGFLLDTLDASHVHVERTTGDGADYGVTTDRVEDTEIRLEANHFNARKEDRHDA